MVESEGDVEAGAEGTVVGVEALVDTGVEDPSAGADVRVKSAVVGDGEEVVSCQVNLDLFLHGNLLY